jgi:hypothetical protein
MTRIVNYKADRTLIPVPYLIEQLRQHPKAWQLVVAAVQAEHEPLRVAS